MMTFPTDLAIFTKALPTDQPTNGPTDRRTYPLKEMQFTKCDQKSPNLTHRRLISEQTTIDSNISAKCHGPTERRDEGMDRHTKQIYVYNGRIKKISYSTKQRLNVIFKSPVSHLYSILSQSHSDNQCLNVD